MKTIEEIKKLLSNEVMYEESKIHSTEIDDNNEPYENPIKANSFNIGFMCARKIILDSYGASNNKINS